MPFSTFLQPITLNKDENLNISPEQWWVSKSMYSFQLEQRWKNFSKILIPSKFIAGIVLYLRQMLNSADINDITFNWEFVCLSLFFYFEYFDHFGEIEKFMYIFGGELESNTKFWKLENSQGLQLHTVSDFRFIALISTEILAKIVKLSH